MTDSKQAHDDWTNEDIRLLIRLWIAISSPTLISFLIGRTVTAVQTRATRLNLPKRQLPEGLKKKWGNDERKEIAAYFHKKIAKGEKIDILAYANERLRTPDSILKFIHEQENVPLNKIKKIIYIPRLAEIVSKPPARVKSASERTCIRCMRPFWSEWTGNRVCPQCTESEEWRELS